MDEPRETEIVLKVGLKIPFTFQVSKEDIALFGQATKDMNPIHFDTGAARALGYTMEDGQVIAHGKLILASADAPFSRHFPHTILREIRRAKFSGIVRSGDTVFVINTIEGITPWEAYHGANITLTSVFIVNGKIVLRCTTMALTRLPFTLDETVSGQ